MVEQSLEFYFICFKNMFSCHLYFPMHFTVEKFIHTNQELFTLTRQSMEILGWMGTGRQQS